MSILYKYRDWFNCDHKNILTKGEIYISSPLSLNDPYDCQITENLNLLDNNDKIKRFVDIQVNLLDLPQMNKETYILKEKLFSRLINERCKLQEEIDEYSIKRLEMYTGVFSLSFVWDSILMWGYYANCHTGFCVGFDSDYLDDSKIFNKGGVIDYSDTYPEIDPNLEDLVELSFLQTHTKSVLWKHEKEYRYSKVYERPPSKFERVEKIGIHFIKEIILGLKFPISDLEVIKDIAKNNNIKLYQTKKEPYKFELIRYELDLN